MDKAVSIPEERPLTEEERELTAWIIEHGTHPDAPLYLGQLQEARVVTRCPCGCASVDFEIADQPRPTGGMRILGDFVFGTDDTLSGIFVFEQSGMLSGLEAYGLAGDAPRVLPAIAELRPCEASEPASPNAHATSREALTKPLWQKLADWDAAFEFLFISGLILTAAVLLAARACA